MSSNLPINKKTESGFLLLEIMIALAVLGMSAIMTAQFYGKIIEWQHEAAMHSKALNLAGDIIEKGIAAQKFSIINKQKKDIFTISCLPESFQGSLKYSSSPRDDRFIKKCQQVTVIISWKTLKNIKRELILSTAVINNSGNIMEQS